MLSLTAVVAIYAVAGLLFTLVLARMPDRAAERLERALLEPPYGYRDEEPADEARLA